MIGVPSAYDWPVSCRIKDSIFCVQTSFSVGRGRVGGHGLVKGYRLPGCDRKAFMNLFLASKDLSHSQ